MSRGPGAGSIEFKFMLNQPASWGSRESHSSLNPLGRSPAHSRARLQTLGCGEGKGSAKCRHSKESRRLVLERPELLDGSAGKVFKDRGMERGAGCVFS